MASLLSFRNVFLALAALVLSFVAFSQNTAVEAAGKGPKITHKVRLARLQLLYPAFALGLCSVALTDTPLLIS